MDLLIIAPVYSANQEEIPDVNSGVLTEKIKKSGIDQNRVIHIDSLDGIIHYLNKEIRKGDAVAFLSAGNLTHTAHEFAGKMEEVLK